MFLKYNILGIIWSIIVFILLSMPGNDIPKFPFLEQMHFDKIVHLFLFAIFVILFIFGFYKQTNFFYLKKYCHTSAIILGVFYGGLTELLQEYIAINRSADFYDYIADVVGCFIGYLLYYYKTNLLRLFVKNNKSNN